MTFMNHPLPQNYKDVCELEGNTHMLVTAGSGLWDLSMSVSSTENCEVDGRGYLP